MENGLHSSNGKRDVAQIARADGLVDATPESIRVTAMKKLLQNIDRLVAALKTTRS